MNQKDPSNENRKVKREVILMMACISWRRVAMRLSQSSFCHC